MIPDDLGVSDTQQRHWRKDCGKHTWYGSPKSLRENLQSKGGVALKNCYACDERGSTLETKMYKAAEGQQWFGAPQAKVLGNGYSDADLYVCWPLPILVMADGEQHINKGMYGRSLAEQVATDQNFNAAALAQGYHVVRLHFADCMVTELARAANAAHRACQEGRCMLYYSTSFFNQARCRMS